MNYVIAGYGNETDEELHQMAFEAAATMHPHAAAEQDWPRYVALVRRNTGDAEYPEETIRAMLKETEGDDEY